MSEKKTRASYEPPDIQTVEELSRRLLEQNHRLTQLNEQLRVSEQLRIEMLSNISHDLRAPATALRSAVDCLLSDDALCASEHRPLIEIMDRRTAALEHLINELYFLMSLDSPSFQLNLETLDIIPFLEEYVITQRLNAKFAQRRLTCDFGTCSELLLKVDPVRMLRVLDNLFDNALRFSPQDSTISLGYRINGDGTADIFVRDEGIGIPSDALEKIFERTSTLSSARTPSLSAESAYKGGTGLGLSIVQGIVQKQGGKVWCESTLGSGSTFFIQLPQCP